MNNITVQTTTIKGNGLIFNPNVPWNPIFTESMKPLCSLQLLSWNLQSQPPKIGTYPIK